MFQAARITFLVTIGIDPLFGSIDPSKVSEPGSTGISARRRPVRPKGPNPSVDPKKDEKPKPGQGDSKTGGGKEPKKKVYVPPPPPSGIDPIVIQRPKHLRSPDGGELSMNSAIEESPQTCIEALSKKGPRYESVDLVFFRLAEKIHSTESVDCETIGLIQEIMNRPIDEFISMIDNEALVDLFTKVISRLEELKQGEAAGRYDQLISVMKEFIDPWHQISESLPAQFNRVVAEYNPLEGETGLAKIVKRIIALPTLHELSPEMSQLARSDIESAYALTVIEPAGSLALLAPDSESFMTHPFTHAKWGSFESKFVPVVQGLVSLDSLGPLSILDQTELLACTSSYMRHKSLLLLEEIGECT